MGPPFSANGMAFAAILQDRHDLEVMVRQTGVKKMTAQTGSNYYQRGLELAESGEYQQGFHCIREHLRAAPHDAEALNDAGAILHCLGRTDDAITYLHKARNLKHDCGQIVWNLVEAHLAAGQATEAVSLFDEMEQMGLLNVDVMNRAATTLLDQDKKGQAIEVLLRSYRLWPEQEVLQPILDVVRSRRPKVAFFVKAHGENRAMVDIREFVQQRFQTEFHEGAGPGGVRERRQEFGREARGRARDSTRSAPARPPPRRPARIWLRRSGRWSRVSRLLRPPRAGCARPSPTHGERRAPPLRIGRD